MRRIIAVAAIALLAVAFQISRGQPYPFAGKTSLAVEAGELTEYVGDGVLFRFSIHKNFLRIIQPLDLFDFGMGVQYFDKYRGPVRPYYWGGYVEEDIFTDLFLFGSTRMNLPAFKFLRFYLGTRLGLHLVDRTYKWRSGSYLEDDSYSYTGRGFDFYGGIKLGMLRFPIGLQAEAGISAIEAVDGHYDEPPYLTVGVYLEY